jgi:DnaJ homolog subfamily A member 5
MDEGMDEADMLAALVQNAALRQEQPAAAAADVTDGAADEASGSEAGSSGEDSMPVRQDSRPLSAGATDNSEFAAPADLRDGDGQAQNGTAKPGKPAKGRRRGSRKGGAEAAKRPELACSVCSQEFSSRTKLFAHISQTGHARPKAG